MTCAQVPKLTLNVAPAIIRSKDNDGGMPLTVSLVRPERTKPSGKSYSAGNVEPTLTYAGRR